MRRFILILPLLTAAAASAGSAAAQGRAPRARPAFVDSAEHRVLHVTVAPGVRLEVLDWGGSGPAVLLLAGMSNSGHSYDTFAPRLAGDYHLVAITRRGLGD